MCIRDRPQDNKLLETTQNLNNYDEWLLLNDMEPFQGLRYGWGPAPPDQYSLWFMREQAEKQQSNEANIFFMITHNSHIPWGIQPPIVDDWRTLALSPKSEEVLSATTPARKAP